MKRTVSKVVHFCDNCGTQTDYPSVCGSCGKEFCYECGKKLGVSYSFAVHFQGSMDGFYCAACDNHLKALGTDRLHNAYVAVKRLKDERSAMEAAFEQKVDAAEKELRNAHP